MTSEEAAKAAVPTTKEKNGTGKGEKKSMPSIYGWGKTVFFSYLCPGDAFTSGPY